MNEPSVNPSTPISAPTRIPEAHVRAEVASFPLSSLRAFKLGLTSLDPALGDKKDHGATRKLWRSCEHMLVEHASGWSLDRIVSVRDQTWFGEAASPSAGKGLFPVPMHRYLRQLAHFHLERQPGKAALSTDTGLATESDALHYRWLTFALPEDLLLAAVDANPPPTGVDIRDPLFERRLLDRGIAEIHHHFGAGMDFPLLWASALAQLTDYSLAPTAFEGPGMPFQGGRQMLPWLLAAAVIRSALAEHLIRHAANPERTGDLRAFLTQLDQSVVWCDRRRKTLRSAIEAVGKGDDASLPGFSVLRDLYREFHPQAPQAPHRLPKCIADVWRCCDPIAARLDLCEPNGGERWFVRQGLAYLEEKELRRNADALFERLFWQVLRLRCQLFRVLAQRPMTAGLQWFIRFCGRIGTLRKPLNKVRPEISFEVAGGGEAIAALEVRTSPDGSVIAIATALRDILSSWMRVLQGFRATGGGSQPEPEFGVVLHFTKERDPVKAWDTGRPAAFWANTHAAPHPHGHLRLNGRYGDLLTRKMVDARALAEFLTAVPRALWLVRGLDVANDELAVPTWVLVPLFHHVMTQANLAAVDRRSGNAPPLRVTAHVGEDFRHLLEGLRRIFETIRYLHGPAGGRLGHATALGVEPHHWAAAVGSVPMPAEERLWDLVFEWRLYSDPRVGADLAAVPQPGRHGLLVDQIRDLSQRVFDRTHDPQVLAEAHHVLHQLSCGTRGATAMADGFESFPHALKRLQPSKCRYFHRVRNLLESFLDNQTVFERGQQLVDVALDASEVAALVNVQNALRRGVGARGIVVEINPSSNLLIGDLLDLRHHPLLRLFPPEPIDDVPPVRVAVGSDDPLTFSTNLLNEYFLLFQTARNAGYSTHVVENWLEAIRQTGMDARFTVPWRPTAHDLAERLMDDLDAYLEKPLRCRRSSTERFVDSDSDSWRLTQWKNT